jgi:drug/metabolite transporter (DMT)-like permease
MFYEYLSNILLILVAVLCNVFAQFSIKMISFSGEKKISIASFSSLFSLLLNKYLWLSLLLYGISFILTIKIYAHYELSIIIPIMMTLIFISIMLVSAFILKEAITLQKIIGIFVLSIGIYIISKS